MLESEANCNVLNSILKVGIQYDLWYSTEVEHSRYPDRSARAKIRIINQHDELRSNS
jgi:hypothetical protein